jgi:ribosome-associated toxin RatA of RatAB toxin-antitoxin module
VSEQATQQMIIRATPADCFAVVTDFERYPEWAADIKQVSILEQDENGLATKVAFRVAAFGRSTSLALAYDYRDAPRRLSWVQDHGDLTSRYEGSYDFEPSGDDTEVIYHLYVELRVPLPGFIKRRAEGRIMGTALRELKSRVEA